MINNIYFFPASIKIVATHFFHSAMLLHNMTVTKYFTHNPWQAVLRDNLQRKVAFTTTRWVFIKQSVFICFCLYFLLTDKTCYNVSSEADKAQTCALKSLLESHTFIVYIKPWPSIIHSICVCVCMSILNSRDTLLGPLIRAEELPQCFNALV